MRLAASRARENSDHICAGSIDGQDGKGTPKRGRINFTLSVSISFTGIQDPSDQQKQGHPLKLSLNTNFFSVFLVQISHFNRVALLLPITGILEQSQRRIMVGTSTVQILLKSTLLTDIFRELGSSASILVFHAAICTLPIVLYILKNVTSLRRIHPP